MEDRAKGLSPNIILAMMGLASVAIARALLPIEGPPDGDFALFLMPWMNAIHQQGLASIAGGFSEYTPPYIYLLNLAALIEPAVGTVASVKLVNVPFVISCAWGLGAIVRHLTDSHERGIAAAAVTAVCPSLLVNAFAFGQCDAIFAGFLIWFVYFALSERPLLAALMFGLAFAFKAQALFAAPLIGVLLLWRRMAWWHVLLIPATYLAMMVPAAFAGRPWSELLTIYLGQTSVMHELSLNAPNPWWFLKDVVAYRTGVIVGLVAGAAAAAAIAWRARALPRSGVAILLIATVSVAVLPWVLPKMTSRYFIVADLLTIALAFVRPQLWPAAVLIQVGSLVASLSYFYPASATAALAFGPTTLGVGILTYALFTERKEPTDAPT